MYMFNIALVNSDIAIAILITTLLIKSARNLESHKVIVRALVETSGQICGFCKRCMLNNLFELNLRSHSS
jgi:aerobic-type carbon monoxide dehydrogenase small subunit (CoxS/CutS family)